MKQLVFVAPGRRNEVEVADPPPIALPRGTLCNEPLCDHLELEQVGWRDCPTCTGVVTLKTYGCKVHGECVLRDGLRCEHHTAKQPNPGEPKRPPTRWVCGVTTVPSRFSTYLPRTLKSLEAAGFPKPRLFVDGDIAYPGHTCTVRGEPLGVVGNWLLALWELVIREPEAHRYAMFQDDVVLSRNTRQYLAKTRYPEKGYCNLYTTPLDQANCGSKPGWYRSHQLGKGAVALIFSKDAAVALLCYKHFGQKVVAAQYRREKVDGGIAEAMTGAGWVEHVHNPSLAQHVGEVSSMPNHKYGSDSVSFKGEEFDSLDLLQKAL